MPYRCSYNVLTLPVIYLIFIVKGGMSGVDVYARAMMIQSDNLGRFGSQAV